jgi:hypothetical protein
VRPPFLALDIVSAIVALALAPAVAQAQFSEGIQDSILGDTAAPTQSAQAYGVVKPTHATFQRIVMPWRNVAPRTLPAGFDPSNPAGPFYHWATFDNAIKAAAAHHLKVILTIYLAPSWAEGPNRPTTGKSYYISPGSWDPNPQQFAKFVHAAATRYSGSFPDPQSPGHMLPRVKFWEMWNEPNIPGYFAAPNSPDAYRTLLNTGYQVVKAVHDDNTVLMAGTSPVGGVPYSMSPLAFQAAVLCLKRSGTRFVRSGSCPQHAHFDVMNHHPYAFASTPTKHAFQYDDLLVPDMPKLQTLLSTAERLHTISGTHHQLWATEFAWATSPPNTAIGDKEKPAARYVAYSMYEMWKAGVSLVVWTPVIDKTVSDMLASGGTGLLDSTGAPKLVLNAFAFPFIAAVQRRHGSAWGRVPGGSHVKVHVQRQTRHGWRTVATARTGSDGVFTVRFGAHGNATYRAAVLHGQTSLAYFSAPIPPKRLHKASSSFG